MNEIEAYWQRFIEQNGEAANRGYTHYFFCDNEKDASELAELVLKGVKRATASSVFAFMEEGAPLPKPGDFCIVTDYHNRPKCVVQTTKVEVVPFCEVTEAFARVEGEGDGSLAYWRQAHTRFFSRECERMGRAFANDMPVVCEQFAVVFR